MGKHIDNLVQDCSISIANAPEALQSFNKHQYYTYETIQPNVG